MARPSLTQAVAGEKNTASAYNSNNNSILTYIEELTTTLSQTIETRYSGLSTQITNLNTLVTDNQAAEQLDIQGVYTAIAGLGAYSEISFDTTTGAWYREIFSNAEKTQRIWLETGGTYTSDSVTNRNHIFNYVLTFPKSFTNNKFYFQRSVQYAGTQSDNNRYLMYNEKNYDYITGREGEGKLSSVKLDVVSYTYSHGFVYYACGV